MCTINQLKKRIETTDIRGKKREKCLFSGEILKKAKKKARRMFERTKTKDKETHHKRPNGESEFENMKLIAKKTGEEMKRKTKAKRKIRA